VAFDDEFESTRFTVVQAWWSVTGDPQPLLSTRMDRLHPFRIDTLAVRLLGEIGPPATAAVPFLREVRERRRRFAIHGFNTPVDQDEELQDAAALAVRRIEGRERRLPASEWCPWFVPASRSPLP
jgi:hypothetical protein